MAFKISGLQAEPFQHLYGLADEELTALGVVRVIADKPSAFPDRIEMRDVEPGETVLLLNHEYQPADSPYKASHAIYVREGATETFSAVNEIPDVLASRLQALRAFDAKGIMLDAEAVEGRDMEPVISRMFDNPNVEYIQTHNAKRGCYSGRIDRA